MKLGLMFVNSGPFAAPDRLAALAPLAERCGFESLWSVEHVVIPQHYESPYPYSRDGKIPGGDDGPIGDPLLALAYAAALTKTIKLATGVMILPQRNPLYVAKEMATLDVLSRGRAMLGIGSGWLKEEFDALGLDFRTRGRRTDEAIEAMRALWRDHPSSFHGKHFSFGPVKMLPKPVQKGGVPIVVGGASPAAARRAARYGDGFFPASGVPDTLKGLFAMLREECAKLGRDLAGIELSCMARPKLDFLKAVEDLGVVRGVIMPPAFDADGFTRGIEKIADEVIAKL
jgi:probable F420-dependent oxidoreductase